MTDYKITLPDGTTFQTPTSHETLQMALAYQNETNANEDLRDVIREELREHNRKQAARNPIPR